MNESVVRALIDAIVFLEFSDEAEVNSDSAIGTMEAISSQLEGLSQNEKLAFLEISRRYALEFEDVEVQEFVNSLDRAMGWQV